MFAGFRPYIPTAILAFGIFYFAFQALTGDRGLLLAHQRKEFAAEKQEELTHLHAQRAALEARAKFLRDENISRDLLEERAHALLGFADPRDYVIREIPDRG